MQKYLALISHFLQKEETCFLPGIGVLKHQRKPATEADNHILPPSSLVVLDKNATQAQHLIIDEIKDHFHLSEKEAAAEWNKTLEVLKKQAAPVVIPGIGTLKKDKENTIHFTPCSSADFYAPVSFGEAKQQSEQEVFPPYEEKTNRTKKIFYILFPLILLALFALGYFGYQYFFNPPSKTIQDDPAVTPVESTGPPFSSTPTTDSVKARKAALQKTETTDSIHFAVIYKVYHSRQSAERHYKRMRNWGHDVSIYTPDSTTFMLGYPFYALPADTTQKLEKIQDTYGGTPFIIYPEK